MKKLIIALIIVLILSGCSKTGGINMNTKIKLETNHGDIVIEL